MPAVVEKCGNMWCIVNKNTGEVYGKSHTKADAQRSANARNAARHGWKPTGAPARK